MEARFFDYMKPASFSGFSLSVSAMNCSSVCTDAFNTEKKYRAAITGTTVIPIHCKLMQNGVKKQESLPPDNSVQFRNQSHRITEITASVGYLNLMYVLWPSQCLPVIHINFGKETPKSSVSGRNCRFLLLVMWMIFCKFA